MTSSAIIATFSALLVLAMPAVAEETPPQLTEAEALALWSLAKWSHTNCPTVKLNPFVYMVAAGIEKTAPKELLARAETEVPRLYIESAGSVEAACVKLQDGN